METRMMPNTTSTGTAKPVIAGKREARLHVILDMVKSQDRVSIQEMVNRLGVSAVTLRKDLETLEERGDIIRTFGGAVLTHNNDLDLAFQVRARLHDREKRLIGMAAAQLIQPGESVIIDAGSTALEVVRHLKGISSLHVITPALNIALEAGALPQVTVIVPGTGILDQISMSLEGADVEEAFGKLHADKYFMGLRSVDLEHGLMDTNMRRISLKRSMMRAARQTIALADSSKLGQGSLVQIAPLNTISTLVTDDGITPEFLAQLTERGVRVVVAGENG